MVGNPVESERNPVGRRRASLHPQGDPSSAQQAPRGFDPVIRQRVPLVGHPMSIGSARPWSCTSVGGGASRIVVLHSTSVRSPGQLAATRPVHPKCRTSRMVPRSEPSTKEVSREQAYLPAEQPSPSQGARVPPAHADPRRPLDPVGPPSQGPQGPGRLSLGSATLSSPPVQQPSPLLPAAHRLTDASSYREVTRHGRRASSRSLMTYVALPSQDGGAAVMPPRVGLVVSKAVGNSVARNRVKRRLRHLLREQVVKWPAATTVVVRALPAAAGASSATLGRDLERCLARSLG